MHVKKKAWKEKDPTVVLPQKGLRLGNRGGEVGRGINFFFFFLGRDIQSLWANILCFIIGIKNNTMYKVSAMNQSSCLCSWAFRSAVLTIRRAILSERRVVLLGEYVMFPCKEQCFEVYNYVQYWTGNYGFGGFHSRCLVAILGCLRKTGFQSSASPPCLNPCPLDVH